MRCMVMVRATRETEAGVLPSEELLAAMTAYNEQLVKAGVLLAAEGLQPSARGVRVRFSGDRRSTIDGPFTETKELIAGFWLWQVRSLDEAIEWAKRCPNPTGADSELEIRPVFEPEGVRGDLLARLGRLDEARQEFDRAAALTRNARERELMLQRSRNCDRDHSPAAKHCG